MLVESWLLRAARRHPDRDALVADGERLSYRALRDAVDAEAERLWRAGARPGERIGLVMPPGRGFVLALHATLRIGAIAVPLDPRLPDDERARRLIDTALTLDGAGNDVVICPPDAGKRRPEPDEPRLLDHHDLDAAAIVVHTSGTSGAAKPIPLTYGNWLWSALGSAATLGCPPGERWLCAMPLSHVGGLSVLLRSAIAATTAVVHGGWDTERVLAALTSEDGAEAGGRDAPTIVSLVPTTLRRLLDAGLRGPGAAEPESGTRVAARLRWVLLGGAAIPAGLLDDAAAAGIPIAPTYGMSEATSQIATLGPPLFCTTVRIDAATALDADDREDADRLGDRYGSVRPSAAPDVVGEILVRGPTVSAAAIAPDGWLHTGDLGRFDDRGRLSVVGRLADTVITGGENVLPLEVERVLDQLDDVRESAVFGRPDPEWGQRVCALVVVDDPTRFDVAAAHAVLRTRLAPHQVPREIELVDDLPRTPSGKLLRRALS